MVADEADRLHQLRGLIGVHAGSRLIEKKKLRLRRKGAGDLELSLFSVRKVGGLEITFSVKSEYL